MASATSPTNRVLVTTEIPPGHPGKNEIEQGLRGALTGLPGEWRVTVVCSRTSVWWVLRVEGPRFEWMTVLASPSQQNPTEITRRLLAALRDSKVLS